MPLYPFFYFYNNLLPMFWNIWIETPIFTAPKGNGVIAQLVEQWTENPCVAGSTPARTTKKA